jgi:excisionase family DNA binding protein
MTCTNAKRLFILRYLSHRKMNTQITFENDTTVGTRQLSKRWSCGVPTILRWVASGKLRGLKLGNYHRFKLSEIQRMEQEMQKPKADRSMCAKDRLRIEKLHIARREAAIKKRAAIATAAAKGKTTATKRLSPSKV